MSSERQNPPSIKEPVPATQTPNHERVPSGGTPASTTDDGSTTRQVSFQSAISHGSSEDLRGGQGDGSITDSGGKLPVPLEEALDRKTKAGVSPPPAAGSTTSKVPTRPVRPAKPVVKGSAAPGSSKPPSGSKGHSEEVIIGMVHVGPNGITFDDPSHPMPEPAVDSGEFSPRELTASSSISASPLELVRSESTNVFGPQLSSSTFDRTISASSLVTPIEFDKMVLRKELGSGAQGVVKLYEYWHPPSGSSPEGKSAAGSDAPQKEDGKSEPSASPKHKDPNVAASSETSTRKDTVSPSTVGPPAGSKKRYYAVKSMRLATKDSAGRPTDSRRVVATEIRQIFSRRSESLVRIHNAFLRSGVLHLVEEYMDGGSLEDLTKYKPQLSEPLAAYVGSRVLRALATIHRKHHVIDSDKERGQMHRDVKPGNVMLSKRGDVKLADFGVSGVEESMGAASVVGTRTYMSPQRIKSGRYTTKCDVWSVGILLLEVLLGRYPFVASSSNVFALIDEVSKMDGVPREALRIREKGTPLKDDGVKNGGAPPPSSPKAAGHKSDDKKKPPKAPLLWVELSSDALEFLDACLRHNEAERWSAEELLHHPWLHRYGCGRGVPRSTREVDESAASPLTEGSLSDSVVPRGHGRTTSTDSVSSASASQSVYASPPPPGAPQPAAPAAPAVAEGKGLLVDLLKERSGYREDIRRQRREKAGGSSPSGDGAMTRDVSVASFS